MPRRTPVKELLKEEEVPSSPLRRSSRITNSSPVPTKVVTRRNSASESTSSSTPKVTRGRRSSFSQEVDSNNETQADKKKSTSTVRTRRGSLTQSSEDPPSEESVPKTRTRGSSVPKDQKTAEVKKTTRRRRSVSEDSEATEVETVGKSTRSRSGSLSSLKKKESNEEKISEDVPASTPNKKLVSTEIPSIKLQSVEESSKEVGSPDNVTSSSAPKRRTDVVKIDLDLSVINEASLTEEEISPHKKSKVDEPTSENLTDLEPKNLDKPLQPASAEKNTNIEIEDKSSVEKTQVVEQPNNKSVNKPKNLDKSFQKNTNIEIEDKTSVEKTQVVEEPNNKSENKPKNLDKSLQKNTNIEIEDKTSVEKTQVVEELINKSVNKESTTKNETENEMFDSTMSENSFKLQLSPSTLEDTDPNVNANDSGNKENISPKVTEFACEPMDVDEPEPSPIKKVIKPSRLSLSKKVTEAEHKLQLAEKITDEIDKFLTEENSLRLNNKTNDQEQMKVQNKTLVVNIVRIEENNTKLSTSESNEKIPENEVVLQEKQTLAANSAIEKIEEGDGKNVDVTHKLKTDEAAMEDQEPNTAALDNENLNMNENATELVSGSDKIVKTDIEPITNTTVQEVTTKDTVVVVTNVIPCQMEHPVEQKTNGNATEQDKVDHLNSSKLESTEKEFEKVVDISVSPESEKLANTSTSPEVMDEALITEIAKSEASAQGTESPLQEQTLLSDSKDDEINVPESNNSGNDESINQIEKTDACDDSSTIKNFESETDRSTLNKENIITEIQNEEKCNANEENAVGLEVATNNENREGSVIEENFAGESEKTDSVDGTKSNEENSYLSPVKKIENNDIVINGEQGIESVELDCSEVINISDGENDHESSRDEVAKNSAPENEEKSTNGKNVEEIKADDNSILSRSIRKRSLDRTSITLHETVKAGEDKEKTVSKRIHKVVDLFCAGIKTTADVSINVSLEYTGQVTDSDDEKTDLLEISLVATVDDVEKESEIKKGSKRRKICHDEYLQSPEKREESVEFPSNISTESSPKIANKKTESPMNEQTENSVKQTSVRSDETEVSGGSIKKRKKRESLTSISTIEEKIKESSPNKKVASKRNKKKSESDEDDFNELELEIDGKETPFKEKSSTPFKSPKVKEFSEGEEIMPLDDSSDDSSGNVSEDENNISQSEEKPTLILLSEPLEDSDDNDTTWKPPEENDMIDSESNDSDDDLAESFMEEVKNKRFSIEKSRRRKLTTAVNNEAYETSSSISPKKAKVRKSPTTSARESGNEASPKSKVSISSGDETSGSGKKSKKQGFLADEQESNTKTDNNTSSGKKKINSTPYKYTKVEISSEDEENGDIDHLTGSDENEVADDSDFSEKNAHYVSLLSKSFEDSDGNDTTWRPGGDVDDSVTDESESSEEESFMEKTRKGMSSVSNDSVFEEEDKVNENKAKKRKMFRLSRMNVLENLESSDSRESLDNKKKQMKKETKSRKKDLFTKKTKQSNTNDFQETEHAKKMLPESSEVKNKSKKRKHSNPDDGVGSPSKTKIEKLLPDLREKLNRNKPKNKRNIAKNLYIKPSKKAPSGWSVTNL